MPALVRKQNYANRELYPDTRGESIGVRLKNGDCKHHRWLGFIDVDVARRLSRLRQARSVKLVASRYSNDTERAGQWMDLKPNEYVQGCLVADGVYAVTTSNVRILTRVVSTADDSS